MTEMKPIHSKGLRYSLSDYKEVIHKWLYLEDDQIIDVIMGTYVANRLKADPLWLLIIAPPSSTKTELLRAFDQYEGTYFLSNLTTSTLISGKPNIEGPEPSLIYKLDGKMVILKDFTTVLSMRSENRQEILAQLREIYDGQYSKAFGNGVEIDWHGQIGLIAACTPVYDKHSAVISTMGDRFLLYRAPTGSQLEMGLRACACAGKETEMRREIQESCHKFLEQFRNRQKVDFHCSNEDEERFVNLACFCAAGRCPVDRDRHSRNVTYIPLPEGSPRITKQLKLMAIGVGLAQGKNEIDEEVYDVVRNIALSILPTNRRVLLEHLFMSGYLEASDRWGTTAQIAGAVGIPKSTTKLLLEDLCVVGMVNQISVGPDLLDDSDKAGHLFRWQLRKDFMEYATASDLFVSKSGSIIQKAA